MITKCTVKFTKDKATGWYLEITTYEPGNTTPKKYDSLTGEITTGSLRLDDCYYSLTNDKLAPAASVLRANRVDKIDKLLTPVNWNRVVEGCKLKSKKTFDWLEAYLGISAVALNAADLEIPI